MKKSAVLTAAAIGMGSLFFAAPAQASGCGNTVVTGTSLQGWDFTTDTRAAGSVKFEADHLTVAVTQQSSAGKATGTYVIGGGVPLADQTAQSNYSILTDAGEDQFVKGFSYQLQIDSDGDGVRNEYLVYEPGDYGVGTWHTNTAGQQLGYRFTGDLDIYSQANPNARILAFGFTLGSGVPPASTQVERVTFGCNTFTFQELAAANQAPTAAFTYSNTPGSLSVVFDGSTSTDPENGALSYSWQFGDSSLGNGVKPSHEYAQAGTYTVSLVVTDDKGVPSPAVMQTVTVTAPTPPPATDTTTNTFLPNTGAESAGWLTVGASFLMAGIGWTLFGKRRRASVAA